MVLITLTIPVSFPIRHGSVTVSQHAQYLYPETEATTQNTAIIILFLIPDFHAVTYKNVSYGKKALHDTFYMIILSKSGFVMKKNCYPSTTSVLNYFSNAMSHSEHYMALLCKQYSPEFDISNICFQLSVTKSVSD